MAHAIKYSVVARRLSGIGSCNSVIAIDSARHVVMTAKTT